MNVDLNFDLPTGHSLFKIMNPYIQALVIDEDHIVWDMGHIIVDKQCLPLFSDDTCFDEMASIMFSSMSSIWQPYVLKIND